MNKLIFLLFFLISGMLTYSQTIDALVSSVKENNPNLKALSKWLESEEEFAKTDLNPVDPQIGYSYLFGTSKTVGDQREFEIIQTFRLPWYYSSKSALKRLALDQKKMIYKKEQNKVLNQAISVYLKLVHLKKQENIIEMRSEKVDTLNLLMEEAYQSGEISKPVYDKVRISAIKLDNDLARIKAEFAIQMSKLTQMNGDKEIQFESFIYPENWELPDKDNLEKKMLNNPELKIAEIKINEAEEEISFQENKWLPEFEAGFKSETILNQNLQGFHVGLSIPLWENANKIDHATLVKEWNRAIYSQKLSQVRNRINSLYITAESAFDTYIKIKEILDEEDISESNLELLNSGNISYQEFLYNEELIFNTWKDYLKLEKEYYRSLNDLMYFTMDDL